MSNYQPTPEELATIADSERDDVIRTAARLARALRDIYNTCGELSEVKNSFQQVYDDVDKYLGQEGRGL